MKSRIFLVLAVLPLVFLLGCSSKCKDGEDAECWMKALENPERIEKAIDNLKQIGDKKAEPALLKAFESSANKPKYRERIAEIFKKWKTKSAVGPMIINRRCARTWFSYCPLHSRVIPGSKVISAATRSRASWTKLPRSRPRTLAWT